jgi:hypothetical protein
MPYHEEQQPNIKKLPEGSKAEKIRDGVETRLAEITTIINEGHPSLTRLELQNVGQHILALFDEILDELPDDIENEPETTTRSVSSEDLEQGATVIGDNRSKRFWEIDSETGRICKKFDERYEKQANEPEVQTDGFAINPEQSSIN